MAYDVFVEYVHLGDSEQRQEERRQALHALLTRSDDRVYNEDLHRSRAVRGFRYKLGGIRHKQEPLKIELEQAFLRHRLMEQRRSSEILSVRRYPGVRS